MRLLVGRPGRRVEVRDIRRVTGCNDQNACVVGQRDRAFPDIHEQAVIPKYRVISRATNAYGGHLRGDLIAGMV